MPSARYFRMTGHRAALSLAKLPVPPRKPSTAHAPAYNQVRGSHPRAHVRFGRRLQGARRHSARTHPRTASRRVAGGPLEGSVVEHEPGRLKRSDRSVHRRGAVERILLSD
jgi:hypothetical protein